MAQDSSLPDFWDTRYRGNIMPWDQGAVPSRLTAYVELRDDRPRTLIPGCGTGYEARYLAERGWPVIAIDFSAAAIDAARPELGPYAHIAMQADFFAFEGDSRSFDLVYERAFLCALPPKTWDAYAARIAQLVAPRGVIAGFFVIGDTGRGPPFSIARPALDALLSPHFECVADEPVSESLAVFQGRERWMEWRRLSC